MSSNNMNNGQKVWKRSCHLLCFDSEDFIKWFKPTRKIVKLHYLITSNQNRPILLILSLLRLSFQLSCSHLIIIFHGDGIYFCIIFTFLTFVFRAVSFFFFCVLVWHVFCMNHANMCVMKEQNQKSLNYAKKYLY